MTSHVGGTCDLGLGFRYITKDGKLLEQQREDITYTTTHNLVNILFTLFGTCSLIFRNLPFDILGPYDMSYDVEPTTCCCFPVFRYALSQYYNLVLVPLVLLLFCAQAGIQTVIVLFCPEAGIQTVLVLFCAEAGIQIVLVLFYEEAWIQTVLVLSPPKPNIPNKSSQTSSQKKVPKKSPEENIPEQKFPKFHPRAQCSPAKIN